MILAIDPGPTESAYVLWDGSARALHGMGKVQNSEMISIGRSFCDGRMAHESICVIEMIASYGMAVGADVFETCVWVGRFMEAFGAHRCYRIPRIQIKNHLCHSSRAKDANIRQAIIDRFGGPAAIGKKATPGPLFGMSGDIWAAMAVALTWHDMNSPAAMAEECASASPEGLTA